MVPAWIGLVHLAKLRSERIAAARSSGAIEPVLSVGLFPRLGTLRTLLPLPGRLSDLHFGMRLRRRFQQIAEHPLEFRVFRRIGFCHGPLAR